MRNPIELSSPKTLLIPTCRERERERLQGFSRVKLDGFVSGHKGLSWVGVS